MEIQSEIKSNLGETNAFNIVLTVETIVGVEQRRGLKFLGVLTIYWYKTVP